MDAILKREGYVDGSVGARMTALAGEKRFAFANDAAGKAELLAFLNSELGKLDPLLPQWFATLVTTTPHLR